MQARTCAKDLIEILGGVGWSQTEIATEIGAARSSICRIAAGQQNPTREIFYGLLKLVEQESKKLRVVRERVLHCLDGELE